MRYLLDANICIRLFDTGNPALKARVQQCNEGELGVSAIAFAEVAHGSANGKPPPMAVLDRFAGQVPVLPFDADSAKHYAALPFVRGSFDRLIAAHALSLKLILVTDNVKHFADIDRKSVV